MDNLATFVALLGASGLKLSVLHDYKGSPEQKLNALVRDKLMSAKSLFNVAQFRDPANPIRPTDIEDLFDIQLYLHYFNMTFAKPLSGVVVSDSDLPAGDRIVQRIEQFLKSKSISLRPSGGFNHYLVASSFAANPPDSLDAETINRFSHMFATINAAL